MSRTPKPTFSLRLLFQKEFLPFAGIVRLVRLLLVNSTALAFRVFDPCLQLLQNKLIKWVFFFFFLRGWPHLKPICFKLPLEYFLLKTRVNGADLGQTWNQRIFQVSLGVAWQSWQRFQLLLLNPEHCRLWVQHRSQAESPGCAAAQGRWHFCATTALLGSLKGFPSSPAHPQCPAETRIESRKSQLRKSSSKPFLNIPPRQQIHSIQTRAAVPFWNPQDISEHFTTVPSPELNN